MQAMPQAELDDRDRAPEGFETGYSNDDEDDFFERLPKPKWGRHHSAATGFIICFFITAIVLLIWWLASKGWEDDSEDNVNTGWEHPIWKPTPPPYVPTTTTPDSGWDYVIVGAGAAGCVAASVLAETGKSVLVLEGGGPSQSGLVPNQEGPVRPVWRNAAAQANKPGQPPSVYGIPGEYDNIAWNSSFSWDTTFTFQGKALGGSAAVNGQLYVRPTEEELRLAWKAFPDILSMLPTSFAKIEQDMPSTIAPSRDGLVYAREPGEVVEAALKKRGLTYESLNDPAMINSPGARVNKYGFPSVIVKDTDAGYRARANSATAYIPLIHQRESVTLELNARVTRIDFDPDGIARSVEYQLGQTIQRASLKHTGKLIMAAGALNTPRLLLLSGVGSSEDLNRYKNMGPDFIYADPSTWVYNQYVGAGLSDHTMAMMGVQKAGVPLFDPASYESHDVSNYIVNGSGPYAQYSPVSMGYLMSDTARNNGESLPDLEVFVVPHSTAASVSTKYLLENNVARLVQEGAQKLQTAWPPSTWGTFVQLLKTTSRGKVQLDNNKVVDYPNLYLQTPEDLARLKYGVKYVAEALVNDSATLVQPTGTTDDAIDALVNSWEDSHLVANHWAGSCAVGTCLDEEFRVKNTTNVFVVDASTLPEQPLVHPVGYVMAVAHTAARIISNL